MNFAQPPAKEKSSKHHQHPQAYASLQEKQTDPSSPQRNRGPDEQTAPNVSPPATEPDSKPSTSEQKPPHAIPQSATMSAQPAQVSPTPLVHDETVPAATEKSSAAPKAAHDASAKNETTIPPSDQHVHESATPKKDEQPSIAQSLNQDAPNEGASQGTDRNKQDPQQQQPSIPEDNKTSHVHSDAADVPSPQPATQEKSRGEKRKPESPTKQETKRRRRNEGSDSTPSEVHGPQKRSQEGSTKTSPDVAPAGRQHDIPSGTPMDTEGLDPEAIEAAAIAAQADKEEANNRGRRTTRLATGKIKHVDYKTSANVQGPRSLSPGSDEDDIDNFRTDDSVMEPTRTSRRRAAHTQQTLPPQRSSRRVAKLRSSQEKEQSTPDPNTSSGRKSSSGNGSEGRNENAGARNDEMDVDSASRMNGAKDGRERRRGRLDSLSRRTRQNNQEAGDAEGESRFGTRSRSRENSVEEDDNENDTGNDEDLDMEDEDDPQKRTDEFGWTAQDLTRIGDAMDIQNTIEPDKIVCELQQSGTWASDEATNKKLGKLIKKAQTSISDLKKAVLPKDEVEVSVKDVRAYLANRVWRLKHGGLRTSYPRKPIRILAKIESEEQEKLSAERHKRKLQREADERRDKLDSEMETWRKAQFELSYAEISRKFATHMLEREIFRAARLDRDVERYKTKEAKVRVRLDKAKLIASQRRGEKEMGDEGNDGFLNQTANSPMETIEQCENGEKSEMKVCRESVTSEEDVDMTRKVKTGCDEARREMDRYKNLIAVKEGEAEAFQRASERERIEYLSLTESKEYLEAELYLSKSSGFGNSVGITHAVPAPSSKKTGVDVRRVENRNGGSHQQQRNNGHVRAKGGNGKNNAAPSASGAPSNNGGPSKSKQGSVKNGDSSKAVKRKNSGKTPANATEK